MAVLLERILMRCRKTYMRCFLMSGIDRNFWIPYLSRVYSMLSVKRRQLLLIFILIGEGAERFQYGGMFELSI
jgi:hypothetical protein